MRTEAEVFNSLSQLCVRPGYAHALALICFRDNMIRFQGEMKAEDMLQIFNRRRLVRTEISTLLGLVVQADIDYSMPSLEMLQQYIGETESLLEELHVVMGSPMMDGIIQGDALHGDSPFKQGAVLREPIFYGGESAYSFQYRDLSPVKYRGDDPWLRENKGFSIKSAARVVLSIAALQNKKILSVHREMMKSPLEARTLLPGYSFTTEELSIESGISEREVGDIIKAFLLEGGNAQFQSIGDFNSVNSSPIIPLPDGRFLLFQYYSLVEALYESPFYWMNQDVDYRPVAAKNRGDFTEDFSAERLKSVFGEDNVFKNINLLAQKDRRLGEVDVLVIFGDRLIILQAKSKRLTVAARKGNDGQIKEDFKKAIQDSYDQALACARIIEAGDCRLVDSQGVEIRLKHPPSEIYLFCVLSDHYPALSFQTSQFLKSEATDVIRPPFVMDVFLLDAMTEMLNAPIRFLNFVSLRVRYANRLSMAQELTALSYHLKNNLWLSDEFDMVMLEDNIAADLDLSMSVRRDGVPGPWTPDGILTRFAGTMLDRLISKIEEEAEPSKIELGLLLLTMSEDTFRRVNEGLEAMTRMTRKDGKNHDFTVGISEGKEGVVFHCNPASPEEASALLLKHCHTRKYIQKANRWFGLCIDTDGLPKIGVHLNFPWERSTSMEAEASRFLKSVSANTKAKSHSPRAAAKTGRNELCPCHSGQKYKRCCGRN